MKQILSLDGGGIRGIASIAFLEKIENIYREQGEFTCLADHFSLIGGTSTGAIIGTALSLGMSAKEVKEFYLSLGPKIFKKSWRRLIGVQSMFDSQALKSEITNIVGDRTLDSADLKSYLAIVSKRMDTGSAWIMTNNPRGAFWEDSKGENPHIGNRHYRLADIVRASAAAPFYFNPEEIAIVDGESPGLFVDGALTPHNNPCVALLQLATIPAYQFNWEAGADKLRIISLGNGFRRDRLKLETYRRMFSAQLAVQSLKSMVAESGIQALTLMQTLGRTDTPWVINSEIGDLRNSLLPPEPLFIFQRYDINFEVKWLESMVGRTFSEKELTGLMKLERSENMQLIYEIATEVAEKTIKPDHFGL